MSYILDAIRKSDQQRQHRSTPTLLSAQGITAAPQRSASFAYGIVAASLIAAGIAIGWLRPWQEAPQAPAVAVANPPSRHQAASPPIQATPVKDNERAPQTPAFKPAPAAWTATTAETAKASQPEKIPTPTGETPAPASTGTAKETSIATAAAKPPAAQSPAMATQERAVLTLAELPVTVQQEIPRMSVSVHAYSGTPANRLVGINDQLLREGDTLAPGVRLDEITADGMIFSYKGYRFRSGAR